MNGIPQHGFDRGNEVAGAIVRGAGARAIVEARRRGDSRFWPGDETSLLLR
jgi:hypothetical protein